ncbi:MAG: hypothetical protein LBG97_06965 [Coriobacteriales bacterium]|jgi:hypothetical protein|nr:hypothetical protein [Coriobacteriales bacterium]
MMRAEKYTYCLPYRPIVGFAVAFVLILGILYVCQYLEQRSKQTMPLDYLLNGALDFHNTNEVNVVNSSAANNGADTGKYNADGEVNIIDPLGISSDMIKLVSLAQQGMLLSYECEMSTDEAVSWIDQRLKANGWQAAHLGQSYLMSYTYLGSGSQMTTILVSVYGDSDTCAILVQFA